MPSNQRNIRDAAPPNGAAKKVPWPKICFSLVVALLCYAVVEGLLTYSFLRGNLHPELIWVIEQVGDTQHMKTDDLLGYRLSNTPARMACITTDGRIESTGNLRGNNHGFPDRDDFHPQRAHPRKKRLAVFGDSFSAGPYLDVNWPDRVEELSERRGQPIRLLNFSVFGGGLGNWWSTLTRIIQPDDYDLDRVIFLVFVDDLQRAFYVCDDSYHQQFPERTPKLACGFSDSFDPETFNAVNVQFMRHTRIVTPETFDMALSGDWRPEFRRPFELFILGKAKSIVEDVWPSTPAETDPAGDENDSVFSTDQLRLIDEMAAYLKKKKLPVWVYHFPAGSPVDEAQEFARRLGAEYVNAAEAFQGLNKEEQDACWMIDGHWNQTGSDRFAEWFIKKNGG